MACLLGRRALDFSFISSGEQVAFRVAWTVELSQLVKRPGNVGDEKLVSDMTVIGMVERIRVGDRGRAL